MRNLITDVAGVSVGQADNAELASGVTAVMFDYPVIASMDLRGGGPGTRETDLLDPSQLMEQIDAIVLSGGSAFGLDAASGVQAWLAEHDRGYQVRNARVPIVPGAVLFDLLNGGDKAWGRFPPYRDLAYAAASHAGADFGLGSVGAGLGATTANFKGGIGSASTRTPDGLTVGAIVAVNAVGSAVMGNGPYFWAAPFEVGHEFGGRGLPSKVTEEMLALYIKGSRPENTTLAVVVTDAALTKSQTRRLAMMAHTGMARAIYPVHAPLDGDIVFAAATGRHPLSDQYLGLTVLGACAANVLARAIARAVYEATALPFPDTVPAWQDKFGR